MAKDEDYKNKKQAEHHKVDRRFVDDGAKYDILRKDTGHSAFLGNGAVLSEASRIANSLVEPVYLARIEADGSRTPGHFDGTQFVERS